MFPLSHLLKLDGHNARRAKSVTCLPSIHHLTPCREAPLWIDVVTVRGALPDGAGVNVSSGTAHACVSSNFRFKNADINGFCES